MSEGALLYARRAGRRLFSPPPLSGRLFYGLPAGFRLSRPGGERI
jgi:hypothetical protein